MLMLKITDVKLAMKKLLSENETAFDPFLLSEAIIKMGISYSIDGHINQDFYSSEEIEAFQHDCSERGWEYDEALTRWVNVKSHVFTIIKGHKTPQSFSIVFYLSKENSQKFYSSLSLPDGFMLPSGLMLHLKYDGSSLFAVTGTVYPGFNMDKTIDKAWDGMVKKFLDAQNISFEELS